MPDWSFFGYFLLRDFCEENIIISDSQTFFMISEEHWENEEITFQTVYEHKEFVNFRKRGMLATYSVCVFVYGYPCITNGNMML